MLDSSNDLIVRKLSFDEFAVIEYALMESYKLLKDYEDTWHQEQVEKIKCLLIEKFDPYATEYELDEYTIEEPSAYRQEESRH